VSLLAVAAFVPAFASGRPANEIPVYEAVGENESLADPTADAWGDAAPVDVPLTSAPSAVPNADATSVETASIQAAHTDERLYLRVTWPDGTADRNASGPRAFADAVAVQLPVNTSARPPIAMGSTDNLVNVWYWSDSSGTEELLAGGAGSTTPFEEPAVRTQTAYEDGRWQVVFARDLRVATLNRTSVTMTEDVDVALAVWNGSNMERSGRKSVSEWHYLALGPGPQGPPYETILWSVAGLAVVFVLVVTVNGVRRS
jgi:complex iron-sulfur molybdoenzyme family reductase subunit gamma